MGLSDNTAHSNDTLDTTELEDLGHIDGDTLLLGPGDNPEAADEVNRHGMLGFLLSLDQYDGDDDDLIAELERTVDPEELDKLFRRIVGLERADKKFDQRLVRLARTLSLFNERAGKLERSSAEQADQIVHGHGERQRLRELICQQAAKLEGAERDRFITMVRVSEEFDALLERLTEVKDRVEATDQCVDALNSDHQVSADKIAKIINLLSDFKDLQRRVGHLEEGQVELMSDVWTATLARDRLDARSDRISGRVDKVMRVVSSERRARQASDGMLDNTLQRVGELEESSQGIAGVVIPERDYERDDGVAVALPLSFDPDDEEPSNDVSLDPDEGVANLPLPKPASQGAQRWLGVAGVAVFFLATLFSIGYNVTIERPIAYAASNQDDDDPDFNVEPKDEVVLEDAVEPAVGPTDDQSVRREPTTTSFTPPQESQPERAICKRFGNWELRDGQYYLPMLECSDEIDRLCPKSEVDNRTFNCDYFPSE